MSTRPVPDDDLPAALIAATQRLAAEQGLENVALRTVTAMVGKSTTAVFQHFGNRDNLLRASIEDAAEKDRIFHDTLLGTLSGLPADATALSALMSFYVLRRAASDPARLYLETLYKNRQYPELRPLLQRWHARRRDFWSALLSRTGLDTAQHAGFLADYTAAEETYAAALADQPSYHLLLRDTTDRLFARPADATRSPAGTWLEAGMEPLPGVGLAEQGETRARLVDQAVRVITSRGVADLNLRRVAADAAVAPSQIVYHFGDFAAFRREALVEVLMRGLPAGLDPNQPNERVTHASENWARRLADTTRAMRAGHAAGFYVSYARVLGQACLLATRDETLRSLALQLRIIEGSGIHHLSQSEWPETMRLDRDGATSFAIWIKGHAILNEANGDVERAPDACPIEAAAVALNGRSSEPAPHA